MFVVLRVALMLVVPLTPAHDSEWYFDKAALLAQGLGYTRDGVPTAFYPIGYPAFLAGLFALFGTHMALALAANIVLGIGICLLMYHFALAIFHDKSAAALGVLLYALYPNQIALTAAISNELLYTFLLMLAFYLLSQAEKSLRWLFLCGLVLGYATLTKAQTVLLPLFMAAFFLGESLSWARFGRSIRHTLIIYLGLAVVVLPWTARNYLVFGHPVLVSTNGGLNLLIGNNPSANGDITFDDPLLTRATDALEKGGDEVAADRLAHDMAVDWIKEHPAQALALVPKKIWRLWALDGYMESVYKEQFADYARYATLIRAVRWVNQVFYGFLLLGSAIAMVALWRRRALLQPMADAILVLGAFATVTAAIFLGASRYRDFVTPWITLFAGWTLAQGRLVREPAPAPALALDP